MGDATRRGLALLAGGLVVGVVVDAFLRATPLGINVLVVALAFGAALAALAARDGGRLGPGRWALVAVAVVFAALVSWRDSPWLVSLDLFAAAVAVCLVALPFRGFRVARGGLGEYALGGLAAGAAAVGGAYLLVAEEVRWREVRVSRSGNAAAVARGVGLALPLLVGFGLLFAAADAVFKGFVKGAIPSDLGTPVSHVALVAAGGWVAAGLLRQVLLPPVEPVTVPSRARLGAVEAGVALALVDLLFLAFVLVQLRYLFGGAALVEERTHLTYAQYARHGFFELVVVGALVLPLLLAVDALLRRGRGERAVRTLSFVLVALVLVVMASALQRMRLYQQAYGLTELRLYSTGFMLWLAVVFAWLCATVLRRRRREFAIGALVSGFGAIAIVNVLNPDALIARTNVARAQVDVGYLAHLSDDATPTLLRALPSLPRPEQRRLAAALLGRTRHGDWRSWNVDRSRAAAAVERARPLLERLATP
jgi:hypothetical protein